MYYTVMNKTPELRKGGIITGKDTPLLEDRREEASKDVKLVFTKSGECDVMDNEGKIKYFVKIDVEARQTHECTCRSYQHGNHEEYLKANGKNFECKHIKAAYNTRTVGWK
jgi:hypothetical protein